MQNRVGAQEIQKEDHSQSADAVTSDNRLFKLYPSLTTALTSYRKTRSMRAPYSPNKVTLDVGRYPRALRNLKWQQHCNSFIDKTSIQLLKNIIRSVLIKSKAHDTAEKLLLNLGCSI